MREVDVAAVLAARDRRVMRQRELLTAYQRPLISFTMNIAGPIKDTPLIRRGFALGLQRLEDQLLRSGVRILHRETAYADTGCEAFVVADLPAPRLKELTVEIEEIDQLGRLFDMDVLDIDGKPLGREGQRGCLICGAEGKNCARSRRHGVEELQQRTTEILRCALDQQDSLRAGELACRALLYEACTAPKPGLVDRLGSGSHEDMDIFTFMASAAALQPYFARCTAIGRETAEKEPRETFRRLRLPGRMAEGAMLRATEGVNTHKGAVFLLGLLCGALGRLEREEWTDSGKVLSECGRMAAGLTAGELTGEETRTAGERYFCQYGLRGVRGEAECGFPTVSEKGLPALRAALSRGKSLEEAGCETLLSLMGTAEDTALLHRAGWEGWQEAKVMALRALCDGVTPAALQEMDEKMREKRWSPGGSADLLSVCYFLHFLSEEG